MYAMHALKTPSFFRPASRSASPAPSPSRPDSGVVLDVLPSMAQPSSKGPLNRLTLATKKRSPSVTPPPPPAPTLVQDGSYLEALSLKLSNAVSKALAQPTGAPSPGEVVWNGKRVLPKGRGSALGALIGSELDASASNPHLHRAILRSLHRPLSVLLTNISAQLLPVTSSPEFMAHTSPATPSPAQLYATAFASFAAELLESLDARGLFLSDHHAVFAGADNLRSIRDGLESLIGRIINPLTAGIKKELMPLIEGLEFNTPTLASPPSQLKQGATHHKGPAVHPSITALHTLIHSHAHNVAQYATPPTMTSQTTLATLLISLIWHGLVALSNRAPTTASSSGSIPQTTVLTASRKKKVGGSITPPSTPPSTRFSMKLPPSRPPSPPTAPTPFPAMDARALYNLFNVLPRPSEDARYALAKEAVDEAFGSLAALCALLDYEAAGDLENLDAVTSDLPTVIALPVLLRIFGIGQDDKRSGGTGDVASLLGLSDKEYREACLGGFGRAEECGPMIARKVVDVLGEGRDVKVERLMHWLEGRTTTGD